MKKVIVIGSPGAGKSVFSRQLAVISGLPLIHLDMVYHRHDKTHISQDEFDAFLNEKFNDECWIMDGNYSRTIPIRMENADTVFFLDYPLELCLESIKQRIGKKRPDMPWIEEKADEEFEAWVRNFPTTQIPAIYELLDKYKESKSIIVFHSREEAQAYLDIFEGFERKRKK